MNENDRIALIRKTLGLTLEKFGEPLGVTKVAISNIEKGNRNVTEQMKKSICQIYKVDYLWLTTGVGEMFFSLPETTLNELAFEYGLDDECKEIVKMFLSLTKEERETVKKFFNFSKVDK